jgi:hypothetical protein
MVSSNPEYRCSVVCVVHNSDYWLKHVGENIITKIKVKVKQSCYRPGVAQRVTGS